MKHAKQKITDCFLAVAGMIFIISAAVIFTVAFKPLYYRDVKQMKLARTYGYEEEEIIANYQELIDYNLSPVKDTLNFPTFPMSEEARIHFEEVKKIFQGFIAAGILSGLIFISSLIRRWKRKDLSFLTLSGVLTIGLPMILGGLIALNWERTFILFHELVFQNDYWLFDPVTDPIIDCLPDEFFFHCAIMIVALCVSGAVVMIITGLRSQKTKEKSCRT